MDECHPTVTYVDTKSKLSGAPVVDPFVYQSLAGAFYLTMTHPDLAYVVQ